MGKIEIEPFYGKATDFMEQTVHYLTCVMPPPSFVNTRGYRYSEHDMYRAIVQKMARIVSALRAALLLLDHGFIQEQALMCRIIEEAEVDVTFLAYGLIDGETELHKKFLADFYMEEHEDPKQPIQTRNKRVNLSRDKIFAFVSKKEASNGDPSSALDVMKTIHKTTSGFVHGASPFLMEMYGGCTARFHMNGMRDSSLWQEHKDDIWNYIYRGLLAFGYAALAFGEHKCFEKISAYSKKFNISEPK